MRVAALVGALASASQERPVAKVIDILENMQAQLEAELKEDKNSPVVGMTSSSRRQESFSWHRA